MHKLKDGLIMKLSSVGKYSKKRFHEHKGILPGNSKSLWHAVKIAKKHW